MCTIYEVNFFSTFPQRFLRVLVARTFEAFGVEETTGEPHYHKHIRNIAINWACQAHLDSCLSETRTKIDELREGMRVAISSDHESEVLCRGMMTADLDQFDYVWDLFTKSTDLDQRSVYIHSMGCVEDDDLLTRLIHTILVGDDLIDGSDEWLSVMQSVYDDGPIGMRVTFDFLRFNVDEFLGL